MSNRAALIPEPVLREAWKRRKRAMWPTDFESSMADALYARLVLIEALHGEARRVESIVTSCNPLPAAPRAALPAEGRRYWWQDRD